MILHSPIISGSLTFADGATFTLPDNGVYSGSFSGSINGIGDPETFSASLDTRIDQLAIDTGSQDSRLDNLESFSGSIDTTIKTKLDTDVVISGSSQVQFNDVTNNPFSASAGSVTVSKSIIPTTSTLTLGTQANPFQDLYLSSASLYIDGTQVLSSNTNELIITTDVNQSLRLVETGVDTVQIQTQNGDITFTSTGTGNIELDAPVQIVAGNKVLSSDGNAIVFGDDVNVEGNITLTGNVDGVDVAGLKSSFDTLNAKTLVSGSSQVTISDTTGYSSFSSSLDSRISTEKGRVDAILASATADADSFAEIVSLINSVDTTNDNAFASFYTSSNNTNAAQDARLSSLETKTGSIDSVDSAQNTRLGKLEVFSGSQESKDLTLASYTSSIDSKFGTLQTYTSSVDAHIASTSNPHSVTKSQVGLGNVENTALSTWAGTSNITTLGTVTSGDVKAILPAGSISGSSQVFSNVSGDVTINSSGVSAISSGVIVNADVNASAAIAYTKLNLQGSGIVSGSSQVSYPSLSNIPAGIVSGSSQVDYNSIANQPTIGNGTVTIAAGAGLVDGGTFTTNQTGNSTITLNVGEGVISGSSQVSGITNGQLVNSSVTLNGTSVSLGGSATIPNLVSGSSQISYSGIVGTPTIGNATVTIAAGSGLDGGGSFTTNQTGASTITLTVGDGVVSGSSQVNHDSTTGFVSDEHIPHSTVTLTAGSGLTGGGDITTSRTFNVGQGDGISVAADAVAVDSTVVRTSGTQTIGGDKTFSNNVVVSGNLTVSGTTTQVSSTTVQIGDNIIELNGSGAANGGIHVKDATAPNTATGSLIWDSTNDIWKAGVKDSEVELVTISGTQTLTNKTINGSQLVDGSVSNAKLTNSSVTVTAGAGLTTGGSVSLGGSVTIDHADTSTQASVNNSGRTFIQDITLDTYGHVTAITSATDADTYVGTVTSVGVTAGAGLTGGGTVTTSGTITLNAVGGNGITVNADNIELSGAYTGTWAVTGGITATADVVAYASSDERLKDNIEIISNPIEKVQSLKGVTWNWNDNADELQKSTPNVGVIAQDVEKVLPQLVNTRDNGFKAVDYAKLTGLLIEAIKEQQKQIEELKSKIG